MADSQRISPNGSTERISSVLVCGSGGCLLSPPMWSLSEKLCDLRQHLHKVIFMSHFSQWLQMQRISCTVRFHAGGCCIVPLSVLTSHPPLRVLRKLKNTQTTSAKETFSTIRKKSTWMWRFQIKTDIQLHSFLDGSYEHRYECDVWNKVQRSKETYQIQHFHWPWCWWTLVDSCLLLHKVEITMTWQLKYVLSADMQTHRSSLTTQAAIWSE